MTLDELKAVSTADKPKLHRMLLGISFEKAMAWRREIQVALAAYSKRNPYRDDPVKAGSVAVCRQIESWCRDAFYKRRMTEILTQNTALALSSKKPVKWQVKREWEALVAKLSY